MRILLTGGTGFIGKALTKQLLAEGHDITLVTRQANYPPQQGVNICQHFAKMTHLNDFDAVINLAGEPIFAKRWSNTQKQKLLQSRVAMTQRLATLFQQSETPPHTFISGSATGFYGNLPPSTSLYDEQTPCGTGFTAALCAAWENCALSVKAMTRVCLIRTGMVMSPNGGALQAMLPLYHWHLAGQLGSGKQHWAWISLEDHIQAVLFLLKNANCQGVYNFVAPTPITNRDFTQQLAAYLGKCAICPAPVLALKMMLGERAALLLDNQPLYPKRLLKQGFQFAMPHLDFKMLFDPNRI